jgi:hypothetical protein
MEPEGSLLCLPEPPLVPILSQMSVVHMFPPYFLPGFLTISHVGYHYLILDLIALMIFSEV